MVITLALLSSSFIPCINHSHFPSSATVDILHSFPSPFPAIPIPILHSHFPIDSLFRLPPPPLPPFPSRVVHPTSLVAEQCWSCHGEHVGFYGAHNGLVVTRQICLRVGGILSRL